jgi:prepilin-type N-terminal cleavage/methylation domain-containing protein
MQPKSQFAVRRQSGFSMVELIVVLAIAALILAIGIPIFATMIHRGRVDGAARQFDLTLLAARLQAIKAGDNTIVQFSTTDRKLFAFVDTNNNGAYDAGPPAEKILADNVVAPNFQILSVRIDDPDTASPSATTTSTTFKFTPFGSAAAGTADKSIYVADGHGNVIQVGVANHASGRITMTKRVGSGGTATYEPPPWQWN